MRTDPYPLSPIQQGMLFHWLLDRHSGNDIEQIVAELHEPMDPSRLRQCWQRVLGAFSTLRTSFLWEGLSTPLQEIRADVVMPFATEDLRHLDALRQRERIEEYLQRDRRDGFDLSVAPAMRVMLFQLAEREFRMIWSFHHILVDGRSFETILTEVFETYADPNRGTTSDRPYRDYIDWVASQDVSPAQAFWREKLRGFIATTPLLFDTPAGTEGDRFGQVTAGLSVETTRGLRELAAHEDLTLNSIVMGAWALLLARYSCESEVVFGATKTTRRGTLEGADKIVGVFLATLPVRIPVDPEMPIRAWLRRVRDEWVSLRGYEHLPLVQIKQETELPASAPLFDTFIMFENSQFETRLRAKGGLWTSRRFTLLEQPGLPMGLMAYGDEALALKIDYDARRFARSTIARTLDHLSTILESWAKSPHGLVWQVPILTDVERTTILYQWNKNEAEYPRIGRWRHSSKSRCRRVPSGLHSPSKAAKLPIAN